MQRPRLLGNKQRHGFPYQHYFLSNHLFQPLSGHASGIASRSLMSIPRNPSKLIIHKKGLAFKHRQAIVSNIFSVTSKRAARPAATAWYSSFIYSPMRRISSAILPAICGVKNTFGSRHSSPLGSTGSTGSVTSSRAVRPGSPSARVPDPPPPPVRRARY